MAVVVVVRHHQPHLVQRAGPGQFTAGLGLDVGAGLLVQRQRQRGHPPGLGGVDLEPALQVGHRQVAQVTVPCLAARLQPLVQVDDDTLAQRTLGRLQCVDAELRGQGVQDGQAAADDGFAVGLQRRQVEPVDRAGLDAALHAPAQAFGRDGAVAAAAGLQHLRHRAGRSAGAQRVLPQRAAEGVQGLFEFGARGHLCSAEGVGTEAAVAKVAHRQADRADRERLRHLRHAAFAQDQFGRAAADVDHQARLVRRLQVGHAGVDQARLFAPADDLDRKAQRGLGAQQEAVAVACLAQGLGSHGAHLQGFEAGQACGESAQAGQPALDGLFGQQPVGVEPGAQADRLLQVVDPLVAAMLQRPDLEPEAVRTHVDRGQRRVGGQGGVGHAGIVPARRSYNLSPLNFNSGADR